MKEKQYTKDELLGTLKRIADKTIGADLEPVPFDQIGEKLKEIIEKCTHGKYTTNGANGLTGEIEAFEK